MKEGYRPYIESIESVLDEVEVGASGLSDQEAQSRLSTIGPNKLIEAKKRSNLLRFLDQMKDPMIIILLAVRMQSPLL